VHANLLEPAQMHAPCDLEAIVLCMKHIEKLANESGKIGYALLWLLGVPLPILLLIYFIRG
jgi:hypothetical protein